MFHMNVPGETGVGQSDSNAAEHALALPEQHKGEAFFLGLGFLRPHLPFVAPSKYFDLHLLIRSRCRRILGGHPKPAIVNSV